ncbi:hypothetical protein NW768_009715 [Fusarium equiseti]|uniref:RGS domain-containing protein n=1 Tax=Fusarium equiseti TaxID=61235 RepID=A0ABQ8R244_FUSEQ|nr:hypothetical protein NW768_009715 [Fusarium equiseti]
MQKKYSSAHLRDQFDSSQPYNSWACRFKCMDYTKKVLVFTGIGMYVQVILTIGMWFACRKYHPTFGIPGTEIKSQTLPEQIVELGQGWEWWPSVLWQVVWTWMVAPFLIWKTWGIHDTMGWRTQTIGCCLSSLHATPMFLIASYAPAFAKVNAYFPPSSWIHVSIFILEIFAIFVPAFQLVKQRIQVRRVENLNLEWEASSSTSSNQELDQLRRGFSVNNLRAQGECEFSEQETKDILLTSSAFNYTLNSNPRPLQDFSALNDFSGENIAFLTELIRWKISLRAEPNERDVRDAYNGALDIYANFISPRDADFPLNLGSADLKFMEKMFEAATRETFGQTNVHPATPFDTTASLESAPGSAMEKPYYNGVVPAEFGPTVFDSIEHHIKYLVLTNTWPKFVKQVQSRRRSEETTRSYNSASSEATLVSRLSHKVSKLFYHSD